MKNDDMQTAESPKLNKARGLKLFQTIYITAFRSSETKRLGRELGFEIAVVSVSADPVAHAARLSREWYGALRVRDGWFSPWDYWDVEARTARFEQFQFDERWLGGMPWPSGLRLVNGSIEVQLPPGSSRTIFNAAFKSAMLGLQFETVAKAPCAVAYRFRTGRRLDVQPRYSADPRGAMFPSTADELYAFRPRCFRAVVNRAANALTLVAVRSALSFSSRVSGERQA